MERSHPGRFSVTSRVIALGVEACMFGHCSESMMLRQGGWVPTGLGHSWAGAALGREQWVSAHFPFA